MFRELLDWTLSLIGISRELTEHRAAIRDLNARVRDLEEAFKLVTLELRHLREGEQHEREKLALRLENILTKQLPPAKSSRKKSG